MKVERKDKKGALIQKGSNLIELDNIDEIRTVIVLLEAKLEEIITDSRRSR